LRGVVDSMEYAIEAIGLGKVSAQRWLVRDVNLGISRSALYYLVGQNGAGKTTLLRLLAGLSRASSGTGASSGRKEPLWADVVSGRRFAVARWTGSTGIGGRFGSERVDGFRRSGWTLWIGTGGRVQAEWVDALDRNGWTGSGGIVTRQAQWPLLETPRTPQIRETWWLAFSRSMNRNAPSVSGRSPWRRRPPLFLGSHAPLAEPSSPAGASAAPPARGSSIPREDHRRLRLA